MVLQLILTDHQISVYMSVSVCQSLFVFSSASEYIMSAPTPPPSTHTHTHTHLSVSARSMALINFLPFPTEG